MNISNGDYYGTGGSNNPDEAQSTERRRDPERIVVGVDGSAGSGAALEWAVDEAQLRGVPVHAVMAWQPPQFYAAGNMWAHGLDPSGDTARELSAAAARTVAGLAEHAARGHEVVITSEAVEGHPAEALLRAAETAAVLVVGSRGHGGFVGVLLGSVSQHVAKSANSGAKRCAAAGISMQLSTRRPADFPLFAGQNADN